VHDYDQSVAKQRLAYVQFPIGELEAPHDFGAGAALVEDLAARVAAGEVVAMHCRGGIGRAGMIAACVLLRLGLAESAHQAVSEVRRLRSKLAIESRRQEAFVDAYWRHLSAAGVEAGGGAVVVTEGVSGTMAAGIAGGLADGRTAGSEDSDEAGVKAGNETACPNCGEAGGDARSGAGQGRRSCDKYAV